MPTIKDIAKAAGVSHGTVSNVLNKTGKVSAEKIRRVEETARQLGYVVNTQAQLLRQGAAKVVAMILPTLREDTYHKFHLALQHLLLARGLEIKVFTTDDITANEEQILSALPLSCLAAVISIPSPGGNCHLRYQTLSCPVVFVNRGVEPCGGIRAEIRFDFVQAGRDIGAYVRARGWRRVAFFATAGDPVEERELLSGICGAVADSGVVVEKTVSDSNSIINNAFDLFAQGTAFDGVIAAGRLRADAIAAASHFLGNTASCPILCIGSAQIFPTPYLPLFELDYGAMAMQLAELLGEHLQRQTPLPARTVLPAKGFSFSFPTLVRSAPQTLAMLTLESPTTAALQQLSPLFRELTGIQLQITALSYDDLYARVNQTQGGLDCDLLRMDTAWLERLGRQSYLPLAESGLMEDGDICALAENSHTSYTHAENTLCALPFDPSVQILLYRRDLFEDAILCRTYYEQFRERLAVPVTIEQWQRVAKFFTRRFRPESPTLYGGTMTGGSAVTAACDFLPYYLASGGALHDENGNALLDTPIMRTVLTQYAEMQAYSNPPEQLWWRDSVRQFADGLAATVLTFSNHASYIMNSNRTNNMEKAGVAMVPGGHPLLGGGVLGICKNTGKPEACRQFFKWFYHRDIATAIVRLGGSSPLAEAYSNYDNYSVFPWLETIGENFAVGTRGTGAAYAPVFSVQDYELALGTAVHNMIFNDLTPAQTAALAQNLYDTNFSCKHIE